VAMIAACLLVACGGGDDTEDDAAKPSDVASVNEAPALSGTALPAVTPGMEYSFKPTVNDPDDDTLTFSVANLPPWATFDSGTGEIHGTPAQADLGSYGNVTISVSDGSDTVSLPPFSIDVVATGSGSATLSWTAPTEMTDGSALADLAGYKIYWGTSPGRYTSSARIDTPGITTYVVEGLTPATWYFVATAYDSVGVESQFSNVASKVVN
jgi:hypothetical protein